MEPKPLAQIPPVVPRQGRGELAAQVSISLPKHEASKLPFFFITSGFCRGLVISRREPA